MDIRDINCSKPVKQKSKKEHKRHQLLTTPNIIIYKRPQPLLVCQTKKNEEYERSQLLTASNIIKCKKP